MCLGVAAILFVAENRCFDFHSRTQWKKCMFSGDGEFIVAGSHRQHALYIWDKATGSLAKMLTGQKGETLLDIAVSHISVEWPCMLCCLKFEI